MSVLKVPSSMEDPSVNLAERRLQAGVLGKLFGTGTNAARNIAGLIILILILGALIAYFLQGRPRQSFRNGCAHCHFGSWIFVW
ncbi:hypothetical protein IPG41_01105 [Candidatus Peregrinibacteria bacterium]|nr:MAG: hypothetical protein IPG41_01105 [Candidatus Peregrinibacteria bacterium]